MAIETNKLQFVLEARTEQLSQKLDAVTKKLDSLRTPLSGVEKSFGKVSKSGQKQLSALESSVTKTAGTIKDTLEGLAIGATLGTAFGAALKSAGEFQVFEKQFKVLLGSADLAKERIAELSKFGATTPFELPGVVKASITLETLTKGALSTGDGLRLVGDLAAGSGEQFDLLAVHIGRMYDAFQSGRPFGESAMRLQELGILSGDTRTQLENMQKTGADGAMMWEVFRNSASRFSGMMEEMNRTLPGQWSNLQDSIGQASREIGLALDKIFNIQGLITGATSVVSIFGQSIAFLSDGFSMLPQPLQMAVAGITGLTAAIFAYKTLQANSFIIDTAKAIVLLGKESIKTTISLIKMLTIQPLLKVGIYLV